MKSRVVVAIALVVQLSWAVRHADAAPVGACAEQGPSRADLEGLKVAGFEVADGARRQQIALELLACLGHEDPALRDGIAFEGLSKWLRADTLTVETRTTMLERLQRDLADATAPFGASFAALVLSEVARTDRVAAWLTPEQRATLVQKGATYLEGVRDYRGFDETQGWLHGVAHAADLLMQLSLNPALDKSQLDRILSAVSSQVAPANHFYVYGEPDRLARPVVFVLQRGLHDDAAWRAWLEAVTAPAHAQAYGSQLALARSHDTRAFLLALYAALATSTDEATKARASALANLLRPAR
jgi:hypothetical protein